jgi:CRISPR type IV-associated protein Csf3
MTRYSAKQSQEVYFWGVGDPDKVVFLIKTHIKCLGKRWSSGHGEILSVEAFEMDDDNSWVTIKGTPARPLPVAMWEGDTLPTKNLAMQFPYWASPKTEAVYPMSWVV